MEISLSPLQRGSGGLVMSIIRDVTERRRIQAELERRAQQLETTNRELEAFSYSVSHDLRAPLRAVDGFSRNLMDQYAGSIDEDARGTCKSSAARPSKWGGSSTTC